MGYGQDVSSVYILIRVCEPQPTTTMEVDGGREDGGIASERKRM